MRAGADRGAAASIDAERTSTWLTPVGPACDLGAIPPAVRGRQLSQSAHKKNPKTQRFGLGHWLGQAYQPPRSRLGAGHPLWREMADHGPACPGAAPMAALTLSGRPLRGSATARPTAAKSRGEADRWGWVPRGARMLDSRPDGPLAPPLAPRAVLFLRCCQLARSTPPAPARRAPWQRGGGRLGRGPPCARGLGVCPRPRLRPRPRPGRPRRRRQDRPCPAGAPGRPGPRQGEAAHATRATQVPPHLYRSRPRRPPRPTRGPHHHLPTPPLTPPCQMATKPALLLTGGLLAWRAVPGLVRARPARAFRTCCCVLDWNSVPPAHLLPKHTHPLPSLHSNGLFSPTTPPPAAFPPGPVRPSPSQRRGRRAQAGPGLVPQRPAAARPRGPGAGDAGGHWRGARVLLRPARVRQGA
jgi:hypothetical protein